MRILRKKGKFAEKKQRKGLWRSMVMCIAALVVFCTTYALILPAITMETQGFSCGLTEHQHSQDCYQLTCGKQEYYSHTHGKECYQDKVLVCKLTERTVHHHSDDCYSKPEYACGLKESKGHAHSEGCYTTERSLICTQSECAPHTHSDGCYTVEVISCKLEESKGHSHSEDCYTDGELTCSKEESEGHTHSDACTKTKQVLTCTLAETQGHSHGDSCYEEKQVLSCGKEERKGHTHSDKCYPSDFQSKLICGQEDIPEHRHSQSCYTRICELEEHTHSELCIKSHEEFLQNKEELLNKEEQTDPKDNSSENEKQITENSEEQPSENEEQTPENPEEQPSENEELTTEDSEEQPSENEEQTPENSEEQPSENEEQTPENSEEQPSENEEQTPENSEEQPSEEEELTPENSEEQPSEEEELTTENSEEQPSENEEQTPENSEEQPSENEELTTEDNSLDDPDPAIGDEDPEIEVDWTDPESAIEAGFYPVCDNYEEEHVHTQECYVPAGEQEETSAPALFSTPQSGENAGAPVLLSEPVSFLDSLQSVSGQVTYHPGEEGSDPYYFASVIMNYATTKEKIVADGKSYYLDLSEEIIVVDPNQVYSILDEDKNMTAGQFRFEKVTGVEGEENGHYRMIIEFSDAYLNKVDGPISGKMFFSGNVDAGNGKENGDFEVGVVGDNKIYVKSEDVIFDNKTGDHYDIQVEKTHSKSVEDGQIGWPGQPGKEGHVKLTYTVTVSSSKGTPGPISLTDQLSWTQSGSIPKTCNLIGVKVDGADVSLTPSGEGQNREFTYELTQLDPGGTHTIEYTYDYVFDSGDSDSVYGVDNTVTAESKVPGGRPEEKITAKDTSHENSFSPPFNSPDISKSGELNQSTGKIDWTIVFNGNKEIYYTWNAGYAITDQKLKDATDLKFLVDGVEYSDNGVSFDSARGTVTIGDSMSGKTVEIVYSTDRGTVGNFGDVSVQTNIAQYEPSPWSPPYTSKADVSKQGGGLLKQAGNINHTSDGALIPWTITITPGLDGIPTDKPLTDTLLTDNHSFDPDSLKVVYVDDTGAVVGEPITGYTSDFSGSSMTLQFSSNPFAKDGSGASIAPDGATAVQVQYNTKANEGLTGTQNLGNKSNLDPFESTVYKQYTPSSAVVTKKASAGQNAQGNAVINWEIWVSLDQGNQITTGIADSLKGGDGEGIHYFIEDSVQIYYAGWGWQHGQLSSGFDVHFYKDGTLPSMTGEGNEANKNTYMVINFTDPPLNIPQSSNGIVVRYQTVFDGTAAQGDIYRNKTWVMNKNAEATYTPPETEMKKSHGNFSVKNDHLTIPWTVDISTADGKITNPIRDSLRLDDGTFNQYFNESVQPVLCWVDEWNNSRDQIPFTVTYYRDYDGNDLTNATGTGFESGKNTYMELTLTDAVEGVYTIPWGGKAIRLTYATVTDGIPDSAVIYKNAASANGKKAVDEAAINPEPPKLESKWADENNLKVEPDGITAPWTVKIKRGTLPLTTVSDALYGTGNGSLTHYFLQAPDSITIEYADSYGNGMGKFVAKDSYSTVFYTGFSETSNENGTTTLASTGTEGDPKSTYMEIRFSTDPFEACPEGTTYLLLRYSSKTDGVPTDGQRHYIKNTAAAGNEKVYGNASYISTSVTKKAQNPSTGNFEEGEVDIGKNKDGALSEWEIQIKTGKPHSASQLVVTDKLPEYVLLTGIRGYCGYSWQQPHEDLQLSLVPVDENNAAVSGGNTEYEITGSCSRAKEDEPFALTLTVSKRDGKSIPNDYVFSFYLAAKVDLDNLPAPLVGKNVNFSNTANVSYDGIIAPSLPSVQKWEHDYDVAENALNKNQFFAAKKKSLVYTVEINPAAKDLELNSDTLILIDTLTYSDNVFNDVTGIPNSVTLQRLNITLNTDPEQTDPSSGASGTDAMVKRVSLYNAQVDENGIPILVDGKLVKGDPVPTTNWAMTTDRLDLGNHQIQNVIRLDVPDNRAMILEYAYDVKVEFTSNNPAITELPQLQFSFEAENTVDALGHKNASSTAGGKSVRFLASTGGGSASAGAKTLTIKKVDSVNESVLLGGAKFDLMKYSNGTWTSILNGSLLETSSEDETKGTIVISTDTSQSAYDLDKNTLYKIVETDPPKNYAMPDSPDEIKFYISGDGTPLADELKQGAIDLSAGSETVTVTNTSLTADFAVRKYWTDRKGNPVVSKELVTFDLVQLRSDKKPSEVFNPLASTRTVKVSAGNIYYSPNPSTAGPITVLKGTKVLVTITSTAVDFTDIYKAPKITPSVPGAERRPISSSEYQFVIPVSENLDLFFGVDAPDDTLSISVVPLSNGNGVSGSANVTETKRWKITLGKGGNYTWYSKDFDAVEDVEGQEETIGKQPLLYSETIGGTQYWYSYYVQENGGNYDVTYSNVDANGKFVGVSFTNINVTNAPRNTYTLPQTGGMGTEVYTVTGLALSMGAILGLMKKRKKGDRA